MCHSLGRNRLEKLYMGNGSYYIVYHITDYRNEIRDNDFNRSLCCICMDRDNDTENDEEVEKLEVINKMNIDYRTTISHYSSKTRPSDDRQENSKRCRT